MAYVIRDLDTVIDPDRACELHKELVDSPDHPFIFRYPIKYYRPHAGFFWIRVKHSWDVINREEQFSVDFSHETFFQFSEDTPDKAGEAMDVINAIMEGVFCVLYAKLWRSLRYAQHDHQSYS